MLVAATAIIFASGSAFANTAWLGTSSANWSDTANWNSGLPNVTSGVLFNVQSTGTLVTNQDIPALTVLSIGNQAVPNTAGTTPVSISGLGITIDSGGINNNGATQDMTISTDLTLSATQSWTQAAGRTMTVNGTNLYLSNSTASQTLTITVPSASGTVNLDTNISDSSATGAAASNLAVTSTGTSNAGATIRITGNNTYTGTTNLNGRATIYQIGTDSAFGTGVVSTPLNTTVPQLQAVGAAHSISNAINLSGGIQFSGANSLTFTGPVTTSAGRTISYNSSPGANLIFNNTITIGTSGAAAGTLTTSIVSGTSVSTGMLVFNGAIQEAVGVTSGAIVALTNGNGGAAISVDQLNGQNTYFGGTTLSGQGSTVQVGSSSTLSGSTIVSGPLGKGTLTFNNAITAPRIEAVGGAQSVANAVVLTSNGIVQGTNNLTLSGAISGAGTLTKNGSGALVLSGPNSYGGATMVTAGALLVTNTNTGSGGVTITGGTFGGNGSVASAVSANSGGNVSPGTSGGNIAVLGTGALTFQSGSTFVYDIDSSASLASAADLLNANGALAIATSGALLSIADAGNTVLPANTKFTLISYSGTWNGNTFDTHPDDSNIIIGANTFVLNYNDVSAGGSNFGGGSYTNAVTLTLTAVPEAGPILLGGVLCLAIGLTVGTRKMFGKRAPA
jgi:fibronectin-binding autotransporter adhesin